MSRKGGGATTAPRNLLLKLRLHGNGPHDKNANQEDIKNIEPIMKSLLHLFRVASGYVLLKTDSPFQHIM